MLHFILFEIWKLKCSLIQELMLYKFKLSHYTKEETKNNCCAKGKGIIDHNSVMRWSKKFRLSYKNFNNQVRSCRPKIMNPEAMLQVIETTLASRIQRVSGELSISQFSVVHHLHNLGTCIQGCWISRHITKILPNFWLTWVSTLIHSFF